MQTIPARLGGVSHRYRLEPALGQVGMLVRHCADARYVWNLALEQTNFYRPGMGSTPSYKGQAAQLAEARKGTCLGEGSSLVQQTALKDFHQGMRNWWGGSHRRPTWRRRFVHESFCIRDVVVGKLSRKWAAVLVPKLGPVSFSAPQAPVERTGTGAVVGLDRGVATTLTTSDGDHLGIPIPTGAVSRGRGERFGGWGAGGGPHRGGAGGLGR